MFQLLVAVVGGLLGSLFIPQSQEIESNWRQTPVAAPDLALSPIRWVRQELPFQIGRLTAWFGFGCLAGWLGQILFETGLLTGTVRYIWLYSSILVCLIFFCSGLTHRFFARKLAGRLTGTGVRDLLAFLQSLPLGLRKLVTGLVTGLIPHPFAWTFLFLGLISWDMAQAGLVMAFFGGGVLVGTMLVGFRRNDLVQRLGHRLAATNVLVITGYLVLLFLGFSFEPGEFGFSLSEHSNHAVSADASVVMLDTPVANFSAVDLAGKTHSLADYKGKTLLLVTVGTHCPCVESYRNRLNQMAQRYQSQGLQVLGFNSNANESEAEVRKHLALKPMAFPVILDPEQKLADRLSSLCMTETYLIDREGILRYHGRIDDNIYHPEKVRETTLQNALENVLQGRPVQVTCRPALGCAIVRQQPGNPTLSK